VSQGVLHQECSRIFRVKRDAADAGSALRLHRHQVDAIASAGARRNYVLTTGTGSGKSLAYIVPIVNAVLREKRRPGIKAIVVYPMNALANSQEQELEKFLKFGYPNGRGPVTFRRYTGQEDDVERRNIWADPPDILLTNYVMLELILTRTEERPLVKAALGLRFLVLDELHTYRGRQGADVALLVRRTRDACDAAEIQHVGTSATMASSGSSEQQRTEVARVATLLFGAPVAPEDVIGETLERASHEPNLDDPDFRSAVSRRVLETPRSVTALPTYDAFVAEPLSRWIESTFGVTTESGTGRLIRATPRSVGGPRGAGSELAAITGADTAACAEHIKEQLLVGSQIRHPETGFPVFAFRLHQFISRGETVYASIEAETDRYLTLHPQKFVPGDRSKLLVPLVFCRECGQEYYTVRLLESGPELHLEPRALHDRADSRSADVVGGFKGRKIGEDKPGTQPDSPARPSDAITSGIQPQTTLAEV
jgi:ATP-dependent helicase YprA (DUF1998 family)